MTDSIHKQHTVTSGAQATGMDQVLVELDNLKRQSERLDLMNRLHGRMAGVLSITGMIESYSVWLMPHVAHELIGYNNSTRNKKHLFCSTHGPNRRKAVAYAEKLLAGASHQSGTSSSEDGQYGHKWLFETADDAGILLILKEGRQLNQAEIELINDSLEILAECLQRGLEYEELFERASNCPLTGLYNRRYFDERIHGMIDSARRYKRPLTMIAMDLDRFKAINDNLGHLAGDEALKSVSAVFKKEVRSTDLLVRMGGDEFLLILDSIDQQNARLLAERLCSAVEELGIYANETTKLGVSIGLSQLEDDETLEEWLERTDDILYHAKADGRSRVAVR